MGCDSTNILGIKTNKKDVLDFLKLLGYSYYGNNYLFQYDSNSREQITGVSATVINNKPIEVHLRTTIWRSIKDHEIHNSTIRQLKKRFGGSFSSDEGINKYLQYEGIIRRGAEAGCDLAYYDFLSNLQTIKGYIVILKNSEGKFPIQDITRAYNPLISSTNIGLPFLISVLEEYLRSTYISLLKHSALKREIFKKSNIQTEVLFEVSENRSTIEEIIARFKSFQSIDHINKNFKEIRNDLVFIKTLKSNNPRRKYDLKLSKIIDNRHKMIHRFQIDYNYTINEFEKDVRVIENIVRHFYDDIIEVYKWNKRVW